MSTPSSLEVRNPDPKRGQLKVNHHLVGCEYLAGFGVPIRRPPRDIRKDVGIHILHLPSGRTRFSNLNGAPAERGIYNFEDAGGEPRDDVEDAFAFTEVHGSRVIGKFERTLDPTAEDRLYFGAFVANMLVRTKAFRKAMPDTLSRAFGVEEVLPNHLQLYPLLYMLKLGQIVTRMRWHLVPSAPGEAFITSDNPVAVARWRTPDQVEFGSPLLAADAFLTFPITRNLCFLADWRGSACDYLPPLDGFARLANLKRKAYAHEHLFSHDPALIGADEARRTRAEMRAVTTLFDGELALTPPDHLTLPEVRPLAAMLLERLREADLPTVPVGG